VPSSWNREAIRMTLPCIECRGTCCKTHDAIALDDGTTLWFVNGRCPNLDATDRCSIYETRPQACRDFDCSANAGFRRMNPRVATLLTINNVPLAA
jgi:Fe-S-cluster containining protein